MEGFKEHESMQEEMSALRDSIDAVQHIAAPIASAVRAVWAGLTFTIGLTACVVLQWSSINTRLDNLNQFGGQHQREFEEKVMQHERDWEISNSELRATLQAINGRLDRGKL